MYQCLRCMLTLIKKGELADPNNQPSAEQVWNMYSKAEQTAWYVKQKRSRTEAGKCRDFAANIAEIAKTCSAAKGYRRTHLLIPFSQYRSEQHVKGVRAEGHRGPMEFHVDGSRG